MPGGPPWNLEDWNLKKEIIDQTLHILAAYTIFLVLYLFPWPWGAVVVSLGIMLERERIQHSSFPRLGKGSMLDITVWSVATGIAAYIMR